MRTQFEIVRENWRTQEIRLLPGHEPQSLRQRFSDLGIALPSEVLSMYSLCGGMNDGETDSNWFTLWSVERVLAEAKTFSNGLVPFAEGFLSAYAYLYRETQDGQVQVFADEYFSGTKAVLVAESLGEAFFLLGNEPKRLWLP